MNILTFDIEEWYLEKINLGAREERYQAFDRMLNRVLDGLDSRGYKATFFCLGRLASEFPEVIKKIDGRGHDIGCHSDKHSWLTTMIPDQLRNDTNNAVAAIEDLIGKKVDSYRAPAFSITKDNVWAIDVLKECGIEKDASIFPAPRDLGGFPSIKEDTPFMISRGGNTMKEFPIKMMHRFGRTLAYSGGGYFRLIPFCAIDREIKNNDYNICYFHLLDLITDKVKMKSRDEYEAYFHQPGTLKNRLVRYLKTNITAGDAAKKLERILDVHEFVSVKSADSAIDWNNVKCIDI